MTHEWTRTAALLADNLSGERAQQHVWGLAPFYRSPGSSGFDAAIDYVVAALDGTGLEVEVQSFPLDGKSLLSGVAVPRAWEPRDAKLEIVSPVREELVSWDSCPSCLPWWCRPTPPDGAELEVVDVATGTSDEDYLDRDVVGRAVLVHDCGENFAWSDIVARAARHGAQGIVTNYLLYQYEPWRTRSKLPEAVQQLRLPARGESPWAFTIAQPAFERLQGLLAAASAGVDDAVVVKFTIDALTFDSASRYVLATIPGSELPHESILFVAHVTAATKPGANCASGVGLLLEMARTLQQLIADGQIRRPKRSIRFLFGNEGLCSMHLHENAPAIAAGVLASIAFCSVGHDEGVTKSSLIMSRSPDSLPTVLNDILETLIEDAPRDAPWAYRQGSRDISLMHWTVLPYTPWSDNATWAKLGVPAILFMSLPDRYFHTQLLTPEKTDPAVFRRCGAVTGAAALVAAGAGWPEVGDILRDLARRSRMRVENLAIRAGQEARAGETAAAAHTLDGMEWMLERDGRALRSALDLVATEDREAAQTLLDDLEAETRRAVAWAGEPDAPIRESDVGESGGLVPRRKSRSIPHGVPGMGYADLVAHASRMAEVESGVRVETLNILSDELWNLSSGEWDLRSIARILGHEFSLKLRLDDIHRLAVAMERSGYIELTHR